MFASSRNGGSKCIYCAFRAHRLQLQSRRLRHPRFASTSTVNIRYTNNPSPPSSEGVRRDTRSRYTGSSDRDGIIRKFERNYDGGREETFQRRRDNRKDFGEALQDRMKVIKEELKDAPLLEQLRKEAKSEGVKPEHFGKIWSRFAEDLRIENAGEGRKPFLGESKGDKKREDLMKGLRDAYATRGLTALDSRIKYAFYAHLTGARFTASDIRNQQALADLRYPSEWFPATRSIHRTIHLHVGPTNSGKTYHALQWLEQAEKGVYAGPLRLLAHEVYTRMNAKGKACSLVTGEERRIAVAKDGSTTTDSPEQGLGNMSACTVEMMPLNKTLDCAVIDEIQMIGNAERGWAWTQALLGCKAKEVHLCGETRAIPLIREICASLGEKLEIHHYERLSPLEVAEEALNGDLRQLRKGDCIVSFSVMGIHSLRKQIERQTGRKVATVYGSLPPETRAQQARLFNDPNNEYDFLVASDAVGMGLNLAIKRIIFEASSKYDGYQQRTLGVADIKQIAGRAGRYRTSLQDTEKAQAQSTEQEHLAAAKGEPDLTAEPPQSENKGLVTTLEKFDFPIVRAAMSAEPEPLRTAGLFPPGPVLERFASYFPPGTPFSYILTRLHELSQMHTRFHLCGLKDQVWIADMIEGIPGLTVTDRNTICSSPASETDRDFWKNLMPEYARCIAEQTSSDITEIQELPLEVLEAEVSASREYLRELERLHKGIVSYLWLSYRFAGIFTSRSLAFHVKGLVEEKIEEVLGKFSFSEQDRRMRAAMREKALKRDMEGALTDESEEGVGAQSVGQVGDEFDEMAPEQAEDLVQQQTSLTAGGDHFGGEEEIGLAEPEDELGGEEKQGVGSFVEWRTRETREESQSSKELADVDTSIAAAAQEGKEAGLEASRQEVVDEVSDQRPSLDEATIVAPPVISPEEALSQQQQDSTNTNMSVTPESELDVAPLNTQTAPPKPTECTMREREEVPLTQQAAGQNQFGGTPTKHLAHLDVNASEMERNVHSRP